MRKITTINVACSILGGAALLGLVGCVIEEPPSPGQSSVVGTGRFQSQYQGMLLCGLNDCEVLRAVYVMIDTKTGVEYLAIQGCGMAQLVSEIHKDVERWQQPTIPTPTPTNIVHSHSAKEETSHRSAP